MPTIDVDIAGTRLLLALGAFAGFSWGPPEQASQTTLMQVLLLAYVLFSSVTCWLVMCRQTRPSAMAATLEFALLAGLVLETGGVTSPLVLLLVIPVLAAASIGKSHAVVILVSAIAYLLLLTLLRPPRLADASAVAFTTLLVATLGQLMLRMRRVEARVSARLAVLTDSARTADVRLGCDRVIHTNLIALHDHYHARSALLIVRTMTRAGAHLYRSDAGDRESPAPADVRLNELLFGLAESISVYPSSRMQTVLQRLNRGESSQGSRPDHVASVAQLLQAKFLIAVPYRQSDGASGRLVITRNERRFSQRDVEFLELFALSLGAIAANACLSEELVLNAAEEERAAISRDLHDTAMQPYIGIRLALQAMAREFAGDAGVEMRLKRICEIADVAIDELRAYTARLRGQPISPAMSLHDAVERHAARLFRFYGLSVEVDLDPAAVVQGPLAEALFHMVAEGLSNVLRHTASHQARVSLREDSGEIMLDIANRRRPGSVAKPFVPRSIFERAEQVGGSTMVRDDGEWTVVHVQVPAPP